MYHEEVYLAFVHRGIGFWFRAFKNKFTRHKNTKDFPCFAAVQHRVERRVLADQAHAHCLRDIPCSKSRTVAQPGGVTRGWHRSRRHTLRALYPHWPHRPARGLPARRSASTAPSTGHHWHRPRQGQGLLPPYQLRWIHQEVSFIKCQPIL